ncbi:hypothetical protein [Glycomyces salinus]|uniref:hypothetical protein n=1 Tax=Glycomyces salinus TaxID=980294 RepID=UPI0018EAA6E1|nr:hypothetical protein [Glycomyces salinus]
MKRLRELNAVPGTPASALHGRLADLPRLVFDHSRRAGFTALPSPILFPPGPKALAAFAAWAAEASRFEVGPARDKRLVGALRCEVLVEDTPVRVWVPITGMSVQAATALVDRAMRSEPVGSGAKGTR